MSAGTKRQLAVKWEDYVKNLRKEISVPVESENDKIKRIERLKKDFAEFSKFYFPNYCTHDFAPWQLKGVNKVIKSDRIYFCRAIAREHAKSVIYGLFLPAFEMFNGRMRNMILCSRTFDNACELLMPLMLNLEANPRIIADFGKQKGIKNWADGKFITKDGVSFRALGAGQNPRGSRNEEARPDFILVDDIDSDEEAYNQKRIDKKYKWLERALFPSMSLKGTKRFGVIGNIISKESVVVKASRVADDFQRIDILDKNGKPSWGRYAMSDVNYMLSKMSYAAGQAEYFNNPINEGTVFKDLTWAKVPSRKSFKFVVHYGDPAPSNKENKDGCQKAVVEVGEKNGVFYIIRVRLEHVTNYKFVEWYHDLSIDIENTIYRYVENNSLQDPFYEQVYRPLMDQINKKAGASLYVNPDERKKPDKFTRIEGTLEPLNRFGKLVFNVAEKDNPHMKRLAEQFEAVEPALSAPVDGVDAVEGAVWFIQNKLKQLAPIHIGKYKRSRSKHY